MTVEGRRGMRALVSARALASGRFVGARESQIFDSRSRFALLHDNQTQKNKNGVVPFSIAPQLNTPIDG
jgi:hypothetical protein